jgi:dihydrodipicolinate synthase/N-acetylneuraminate lyase
MLLHGIFPPITTPFYADGSIFWKKLEHNVARYSKAPVAGIVVQGSTGEAILLSDQERRDVLKAAREAVPAEKVLVAGCGVESAQETLKLCDYSAELGYDVALVRTPHYYKGQMNRPENMLAFYRFVADRSPIPVLIYNFPQATGYNMPTEIVSELAEHPNLIGIKESSGDIEKVRLIVEATRHIKRSVTVGETFHAVTPRMLKASSTAAGASGEVIPAEALAGQRVSSSGVQVIAGMKTRQKEVGFQVLVGAAQKLAPSVEVGAVGAILAFADPAPTAMYEIYVAWKEGDKQLALDKQRKVAAAAQRIAGELSIPAVKYAMDLNGYYGGPVRLPLLPLSAEQKAEVEQLMADIRH